MTTTTRKDASGPAAVPGRPASRAAGELLRLARARRSRQLRAAGRDDVTASWHGNGGALAGRGTRL